MKINITKPAQIEVKQIKIHIKVRDGFCCSLVDSDQEILRDYEGYVPDFMPDDGSSHYGDYLILNIDIDSGIITNWKDINPSEIADFIQKKGRYAEDEI